jgi:uncharacterized membrane protein
VNATVSAPTDAPAGTAWERAGRLGLDVAGAAHLLVALDHLTHDPRFSVFFLVTGAAQLVVAHRMRRGAHPGAVTAVIAATVGLLVLYLVSRTVALSFGPHADRPEDADLLGTVVVVAELVAVATLPVLLPAAWRARVLNGLLAAGVAVWLAWFAGLLG